MGCLRTRGDSRGYPPWVHLILPGPGGLARVRDWWRLEDKQGNTTVRGQSPSCSLCQNGLPRISRSQEQTVWPRAPVRSPNQNHVLGRVFLHDGQAEESGAGVQGATQM